MSDELNNAIKKVREEIERERAKLDQLENDLVNLNRQNQDVEKLRESEIKKMFIRD